MTGRARGFTLVEVLVCLVLLGMLATIMLSATRLGLGGWTRAERQADAVNELAAAQMQVRRMVAHAYPAFVSADPADTRIRFDGHPEFLGFVGPVPGAAPDSAWAAMRLRLAGQTLVLDWQADFANAPPRTERLLGAATRLEISYWGPPPVGGAFVWQPEWTGRDAMPALVRIRIARATEASVAWPDLVVAPRVTANVQCAYDARDMTCRRTP